MNAVDTNILVYSVDQNEPVKRQTSRDLLARLSGGLEAPILLWQVAVEFVACLKRWESKGVLSPTETTANWRLAEQALVVLLPQSNLLPITFDLLDRYSLSYWDALLLAACIDAGVDTLYSEDLSHDMKYDSVTVVNPFA